MECFADSTRGEYSLVCHFFCEKEGFPMCRTGNTLRKRQSALWRRNFFVFTVLTDAMKHISAALQTESMIPEQMRKENIRRSGINSVLFLSIHYPVKWVVSGAVSFDVLSAVYIVLLLALHFFCDAVYKRTNCLWGAVILHIIYNAVGAMIIIQ